MKIKQIYAGNDLLIQEGLSTCGPVSLLNILRLKGDKSYNEEELAEKCNARPGIGTDNDDLVKVAREIGLEVVETKYHGKTADIEHHIDNGAYVIVCYHNAFSGYGHYSVITEYDDEALYFRDSSAGLFRMRKEFFPKWWHGSNGCQQWFAAVK